MQKVLKPTMKLSSWAYSEKLGLPCETSAGAWRPLSRTMPTAVPKKCTPGYVFLVDEAHEIKRFTLLTP